MAIDPSSAPAPDREQSETQLPDASSPAISRALDAVLARFEGTARRIARTAGLPPSDVDDVLQEVRIRLWRALGTAERIREAHALYLKRTVSSAVLDLLRRRRARRELSLETAEVESEPVAPDRSDAAMEQSAFDAAVARGIDALPEARRVVVRLYLTGYKREEIATMLGWSEAKTRNLLYRGLADLRERLEHDGVVPRSTS